MRIVARFAGLIGMALVVLATAFQVAREMFLSAPGLVTKEGRGEIYMAGACLVLGYAVWKWGNAIKEKRGA